MRVLLVAAEEAVDAGHEEGTGQLPPDETAVKMPA